jgi:hypothetical protein
MFSNIKLLLRIVSLLSFTILFSNFSYSQSHGFRDLSLSHALNYNPVKKSKTVLNRFISQIPETLYVYGVRVQFKQYNDPNTTGDGTFDLSNNFPDSVDAPPHDSTYFLDHFEFLKNYFYKASKGHLVIKFQLLGNIKTLPNHMGDYSPRRTENNLRLGNLFFDTWRSIDSIPGIFSGIDTTKKVAFVIFHAGVGKDVDLQSQGIFQGELDIPSIYMSTNSLKSIFGDTTKGYYTKSGIIIPNSCIIPEQESRIINGSFGSFYLELGLNGILTASIGSHLGLPDLFNTQTGVTAIGRFGLMDGQSIFSFSGVFPPEPSAWEKTYLGWVNPVIVNESQNGTYTSKAASIDDGNSSVYKVLIDAKEYFLIENRNRESHRNGVKIYFRNGGILDSDTFTQDQNGFQNGDVWMLKKNIVDVSDFDWSLPGLKNDTAYYQGGILIWHIDENVIDAKFASNTINNDINHRGVKLMEAKGSQDIGVVFNTPLGQFIGDGTPYDYWYFGQHYVPTTIYQNAFTPTSIPNSRSYSNFNSRICLTNFGPIDSTVSFTFEQCGSIANINKYPHFVGIDSSGNAQPIGFDFNNNGLDEVFINIKDSLYGFRDNGNPIRVDAPNGFLKDSVSNFIVSRVSSGKGPFYLAGNYKNWFNLLSFTIDSLTSSPLVFKIQGTNTLTSPVLYGGSNLLYSGTVDGKVDKLDINSQTVSYDSLTNIPITELAMGSTGNYSVPKTPYKYFTLGKITPGNIDDTIIVTADNKLLLNGKNISNNLGITTIYSAPIVCDVNKDGHQEIIFCADDKVFAVNQYGVLIDNFPFKASGVTKISSGCSVADLNGDGINEVIFGTGDGRVYAYSVNGKILDGFPVLCGKEVRSTPAIIKTGGYFGIIVYSLDGYLYGWKTSYLYDSTRILWRNFLKDTNHRNSLFTSSNIIASGPCLPSDKVYNWPNPVYGKSTTNIRYFLNGTASSVQVKIMDLSGELVTSLTGTAYSGYDNEVPWDVSNVQSGIYIAVLQLQNGSCNETASIKIAVVK